jgi:hypothetical protein
MTCSPTVVVAKPEKTMIFAGAKRRLVRLVA